MGTLDLTTRIQIDATIEQICNLEARLKKIDAYKIYEISALEKLLNIHIKSFSLIFKVCLQNKIFSPRSDETGEIMESIISFGCTSVLPMVLGNEDDFHGKEILRYSVYSANCENFEMVHIFLYLFYKKNKEGIFIFPTDNGLGDFSFENKSLAFIENLRKNLDEFYKKIKIPEETSIFPLVDELLRKLEESSDKIE